MPRGTFPTDCRAHQPSICSVTDQLGRDFLSRIIQGARVALTVGLAATTLDVLVAVLIRGTSGFLGARLDLVVQRFVDA